MLVRAFHNRAGALDDEVPSPGMYFADMGTVP
jgi:hypothetical protein